MDGQAPLRGADPVNDEFEVGFDERFERRWSYAETAGRVVMGVFVAAALAGLLGRGPFSHRTARSADGRLAVDFEPVARFGTGTQVTVHLSAANAPADSARPDAVAPVQLFVGTGLVEPMGLQDVIPEPVRTAPAQRGLDYTFDLPMDETDGLVRFDLKPAAVGPIHLIVRQGASEAVEWTQVVLP